MKKILLSICVCLCNVFLFAQQIPEGRDLLPSVIYLIKNSGSESRSLEGAEITKNAYKYTAQGDMKGLLGQKQKYKYDAIFIKNGNTVEVTIENEAIASVDKKGNLVKSKITGDYWMKGGVNVELLKKDVVNELQKTFDFSDENYYIIAGDISCLILAREEASDLYLKKYVERNQLIGKNMEWKVKVVSINESGKSDYAYRIFGSSQYNKLGIQIQGVNFYTNNDDVIGWSEGEEKVLKGKLNSIGDGVLNKSFELID